MKLKITRCGEERERTGKKEEKEKGEEGKR